MKKNFHLSYEDFFHPNSGKTIKIYKVDYDSNREEETNLIVMYGYGYLSIDNPSFTIYHIENGEIVVDANSDTAHDLYVLNYAIRTFTFKKGIEYFIAVRSDAAEKNVIYFIFNYRKK
jgi:hypothetical protein